MDFFLLGNTAAGGTCQQTTIKHFLNSRDGPGGEGSEIKTSMEATYLSKDTIRENTGTMSSNMKMGMPTKLRS